MTAEQAIKELRGMRKGYDIGLLNAPEIVIDVVTALDMAIEALSCSEKPNESDTIYRQDAVDALRYAQHRFTVADEAGGMGTVKWSEDVIYFAAAERALTELPSAPPDKDMIHLQKEQAYMQGWADRERTSKQA